MWVFLSSGFISAVQHRDNHDLLMVRARDKKSLEEMLFVIRKTFDQAGGKTSEELDTLMSEFKIIGIPGDYKWRVVIPRQTFAAYLVEETMTYINYANFKNKLSDVRGERYHDAAMRVWSAMHAVTDTELTGNPAVDNPTPLTGTYGTSYEGSSAWGDPGYDTSWGGSWTESGYKDYPKDESQDEDEANEWVQNESLIDGVGTFGDDHDYFDYDSETDTYVKVSSSMSVPYRWGDGVDDVYMREYYPTGTDGYHTFSGKDFAYKGSDDIDILDFQGGEESEEVEGLGRYGSEDDHYTPTDAELEQIKEEIDNAWEPWDVFTDYNIITGETRDAVGRGHKGIHDMSDAEYERWSEHSGLL